MANILPEVQPIVTSMPGRGYELQTGGSARRSFIKNNNNTYFIHGVPGHTHNSSAMISVTAEYTRKRDIREHHQRFVGGRPTAAGGDRVH